MNILSRLFGSAAPIEAKESATAQVMMVGPTEVAWSDRNYATFAREGYVQNVIAYQAINKVAEAVGSIKWEVWKGETELTEHPLLDIMAQPNPSQSGSEYMIAYVGFLLISGNTYSEKVRINGVPQELYVLRSDRMKVKPSARGFADGYIYEVGGKKVMWPADEAGRCDILHTKMFHPLDDWYGLSPLEAGAYGIDQHNLSMSWIQSLLQNSARPSGALVKSGGDPLTDDQFTRLKGEVEDKYAGSQNAGRPMLLEGGLEWKEMGLSPVAMGHIETKASAARDISLAVGVPPMLLGIKGDNTYANYSEARLSLWEDTVLPLIDHIVGDLNGFFAEDFEGVELRPKLDHIPAIVDKRQKLWDMADKSTDLTINERREMKGFEPIEGGDQILITGAMIPLSEASLKPEDFAKPSVEDEPTEEETKQLIRLAYGG